MLVLRGVSFSEVFLRAWTCFSDRFGGVFLCVCLQKLLPVRILRNTPLRGQFEYETAIMSPPGVTFPH